MDKIKLELVIQGYKLLTEDLTKKVKEFVQNKDFPLDERWKIFSNSNLGESENYVINLQSYNLDEFLSDCYKYETINLIYFVEEYLEEIDEDFKIINAVKEEILELFIKEFKYN